MTKWHKVLAGLVAAYMCGGLYDVVGGLRRGGPQVVIALVYLVCVILGGAAAVQAFRGRKYAFRGLSLAALFIASLVYQTPSFDFTFRSIRCLAITAGSFYSPAESYRGGLNALAFALFIIVYMATREKPSANTRKPHEVAKPKTAPK